MEVFQGMTPGAGRKSGVDSIAPFIARLVRFWHMEEVAFEELLEAFDFLVEVRSFRLDLGDGHHWTTAFSMALDDWCFVLGPDSVVSAKSWKRDAQGTLL